MVTIAPGDVYPPIEAVRLQARMISVRAGLQIIRYESAKNFASPPVILIQAMPEDCAHVTLLSSRDGAGFSLDAPGDVIVVKAVRDVRLVATTASLSFQVDAAILKIERISERGAAPPGSEVSTAAVELVQPGYRRSSAVKGLASAANS